MLLVKNQDLFLWWGLFSSHISEEAKWVFQILMNLPFGSDFLALASSESHTFLNMKIHISWNSLRLSLCLSAYPIVHQKDLFFILALFYLNRCYLYITPTQPVCDYQNLFEFPQFSWDDLYKLIISSKKVSFHNIFCTKIASFLFMVILLFCNFYDVNYLQI